MPLLLVQFGLHLATSLAWWFVLESAVVAASKIQYSLITSAAGIVVAIVLTPKLQTIVRRLFTKN